jgi:RNA polymerase sigma-70 factor (ECF subfamily)
MSAENMRSDLARSSVVLGSGPGRGESPESDAPLVRRFQEGQRDALAEIVQRHQVAIRRLLLMLCDDRHEADDLCQEVFLRLIRHLAKMVPPESLRPWLYRIAVNLVRDRARRKRIRTWFRLGGAEGHASAAMTVEATDAAAERRELVERLRREIHRLQPAWREVVVLRDIQGLSPQEVAGLLRIPAKLVNDRLYRARRELTERLKTRPE